MKKKRNEILEAFAKRSNTKIKSLKKAKHPILDELLIKFINEMINKGVNVTIKTLEVKAKQLIEQKGNGNRSI